MNGSILLASTAVALAAAALLPGSLGVLKFTHRFTARPGGAFFSYVAVVPMYAIACLLMVMLVYRAAAGTAGIALALAAVIAFGAVSTFGFLMHTRLMFRPVRRPRYVSADEAVARFGETEEVIGVVDRHGRPFAYIARLARRPHIVYQPEGDAPFIMSHCILSHSSMAYELTGGFNPERIYISSVLANNLVFYDATSHCSVLQVRNASVDGGRKLARLPTVMTTLGAWRRLHPESKVWLRARDWRDVFYLKLLARASIIDPSSPDLVYPLERAIDARLPLKAYVMGVELNGDAKAYPLGGFDGARLVQDVVGGDPIVFLVSGEGDCVQLFSRRLDGMTLDFRPDADGTFVDAGTGSSWTSAGRCTAGLLAGRQLAAVPHYNKIFWCVWADFYPATAVHTGKDVAA